MPVDTSLGPRGAITGPCFQRIGRLCLVALISLGGNIGFALGADGDSPQTIVLHPASAPTPLLKYQLMPTMYERRSGNAAVFYGRVKSEHTLYFSSKEIWKEIYEADSASLSRVGEMKHVRLDHDEAMFINLERAGQCEECDWQYPIAEDGFATLLPDAQEKREFARMLRADVRWRIAHGDFDGAVRSLKAGYAMARHTADAPLIVPALIGIAIGGIMSDATLELIQQPGAPNLYWALTYLPQPFFDTRQIFEGEMRCFEAAFPQLIGADQPIDDPAYWRRQLDEMAEAYMEHVCSSDTERAEFKRKMALRLTRGYSIAKSELIQRGWDAEQVDAMPVGRVLLLHAAAVYHQYRDEVLASVVLPYWEASPRLAALDTRVWEDGLAWKSPLPLDKAFPAMNAGRHALMRQDRQIALLRMLEALRLHASSDKARLPASLEQLEVPVPVDPMTGKPFEYQLRDGVAYINGPPMYSGGPPFQYEVRLATADTE